MPKKARKESPGPISGKVIRGDGRGQSLGFPTANLLLDEPDNRPGDGIYACWVQINSEKKQYPAAVHIGPRPTFPDAPPSVEMHLLDYNGSSLYDQRLTCQGWQYIRPIKTFSYLRDLKQAIAADIIRVRTLLAVLQPED